MKEKILRIFFKKNNEREKKKDVGKNIKEEPEMAGVGDPVEFLSVVLLKKEAVERADKKKSSDSRKENPGGAIDQKFANRTTLHSEAQTHSGDEKKERNPPDIEPLHGSPKPGKRVNVLNEVDGILGPGLKTDNDMIDN